MLLAAGLLTMLAGGLAAAIRYAIVFPRQPLSGPVPPLDAEDLACAARLETHVRAVASRPHNLDYPDALEAAAVYIETTLRGFGLVPQLQVFSVLGHDVRNVEVVIEPPTGHAAEPGTYVIGAHYDAPDDSPGANDNGTGVAALLELARSLKDFAPTHRLRLVFFVNEEQPYGKTPDMGSYQHAKRLSDTGEPVAGMIALETLGHFSDEPGSQSFPFPFGLLFPNRGNFVAFIGMLPARALVHRALAAFRATTPFPSIGGVAPGFIEGIDLSDHWAYDHFGFPAMMVTDTAPFRNPYYHTPGDLPETVDYENLARVTRGLERTIRALTGGQPQRT